jgi:hypothetical protein
MFGLYQISAINQNLRIAHTVLSDVSAIFINVLKLSQGFDDIDVLARPSHHQLRPFMQTVVENF